MGDIIYSIMIDRFVDAEANVYDRWYDADCKCYKRVAGVSSEFDPERKNSYRFWGGDIKGITQVVESGYFNESENHFSPRQL